jgi:nucleotide-binding universal stress UspA family protein
MKTILVPTDFSECANNALRFAAFVANKTGASLNLLHVIEVPSVGFNGDIESTTDDVPYMIGLLKATKTKMKKLLAQPYLNDITIRHNIEVGSIEDHILRAAEKYKSDLIVMGTHGLSGISRVLTGSTANKIVNRATIPVLTIKESVKEPVIRKILYATDFSETADKTFSEVEKLGKLLDAEIEIVKVVTRFQFETSSQSEKAISRFKEKFSDPNLKVSIYYSQSKQAGIRSYAQKVHADLIAIGMYRRNGLGNFFTNINTEGLINHSTLPVMAINCDRKPNIEHSEAATELAEAV